MQQIKVLRENEEILVGVHEKEEYNSMIVALVETIKGVEQVVSWKKDPAEMVDLMCTFTGGDSSMTSMTGSRERF